MNDDFSLLMQHRGISNFGPSFLANRGLLSPPSQIPGMASFERQHSATDSMILAALNAENNNRILRERMMAEEYKRYSDSLLYEQQQQQLAQHPLLRHLEYNNANVSLPTQDVSVSTALRQAGFPSAATAQHQDRLHTNRYNNPGPAVVESPTNPTHSVISEFPKAKTHGEAVKILTILGSNRRGKSDPYMDVSLLPIGSGKEPKVIRGGVSEPFTEKLYRMLLDVESQGKSNIISFFPHGRSFGVHDPKAFAEQILPKYFTKQNKMVSFVRQLNLYGFIRIQSGKESGGYYHELFLKGRPEVNSYMRRVGASSGKGEDRRRCKDRFAPTLQPNFYAMAAIQPRVSAVASACASASAQM